ncbi:helix-turn-helix domain-containing protein [Pelagibius sp.]|uniref:AraC family transcriptional regulator n=1 Tax=Pelagibius sp. TaxID=1931238 RepID=UPI003B503884
MRGDYADHFDFLSRGPYAQFVVEKRSVGQRPLRMLRTAQPPGDFSDPAQPDLILYKILRSEGHTVRDLGAGRIRRRFRNGDFDLQGPGVANEIIAEGHHEVIDFILPIEAVREVLDDRRPGFSGDFGRLHAEPFRDAFLEQLCMKLWRESEAGNPNGNLFVEGALVSMIAILSSLSERKSAAENETVSAMPSRTLQAIDDFIEVNLGKNLSNTDLSDLARLPQLRFARAFKAATGQTPHQYVLARRIARAQELLAAGDMPIVEIAYACGFASQSHMTDVFRQKLSVTPGRYRKEVRG